MLFQFLPLEILDHEYEPTVDNSKILMCKAVTYEWGCKNVFKNLFNISCFDKNYYCITEIDGC